MHSRSFPDCLECSAHIEKTEITYTDIKPYICTKHSGQFGGVLPLSRSKNKTDCKAARSKHLGGGGIDDVSSQDPNFAPAYITRANISHYQSSAPPHNPTVRKNSQWKLSVPRLQSSGYCDSTADDATHPKRSSLEMSFVTSLETQGVIEHAMKSNKQFPPRRGVSASKSWIPA